jgi:hypothetical protein
MYFLQYELLSSYLDVLENINKMSTKIITSVNTAGILNLCIYYTTNILKILIVHGVLK